MITFQTPPFLFPCPLKSRAQNDRWEQRALFLSEHQTCSWSFRGCDQNRCGTAAKEMNCELNIEMLINDAQLVVLWHAVVKYQQHRVVSRDMTRETKNEVSLHQIKSQKSEFHPNRQSSERLLWHTMTEVFRLLYVKGLPQLSLLSIMLAMLSRCKPHHVPRCPPGMRLVHCIVSPGFCQFVPAIFTGTDVFSLVENKHCESSVSCSRN